MFKRIGSFLDIIIFALILMLLASWQLRDAYTRGADLEILVTVAAFVFGAGLFFTAKWGLIGTVITLTVACAIYFGAIWYQPIVHEDPSLIWPNILRLLVVILLFLYIGRTRIENRFSV